MIDFLVELIRQVCLASIEQRTYRSVIFYDSETGVALYYVDLGDNFIMQDGDTFRIDFGSEAITLV